MAMRCRLSMVKPATNGFTLLETMLVLLIVVMLTALSLPGGRTSSLEIFMESLQTRLVSEQQEAYINKQARKAVIHTDFLQLEDQEIFYPAGIACDDYEISWNARGNVSKGGTITCYDETNIYKLVVQISTGRMRIEPA